MGVKGFHEIPPDVIAGQIEAVASRHRREAAKTGMLASSAIIETVAEVARTDGRDRATGGGPGVRIDARRPAAAPEALDAVRNTLPVASLVTPNLDEIRLIAGIEVVDDASRRAGPRPCTGSARSGRWSRAGTCAPRGQHRPALRRRPLPRVHPPADRDRQRPRRRRHPRRRGGVRAGPGTRCPRPSSRQAVGDPVPARRVHRRRRPRSGVPDVPDLTPGS